MAAFLAFLAVFVAILAENLPYKVSVCKYGSNWGLFFTFFPLSTK